MFQAVYTALADPLVGGDEEARERRAARARRAGRVAASTALGAVLVYAIFPVREYLDMRQATERQSERERIFENENERLEDRIEWLRTEEAVEWLARKNGMVYPGEETYPLLPAPEETGDGEAGARDGAGE